MDRVEGMVCFSACSRGHRENWEEPLLTGMREPGVGGVQAGLPWSPEPQFWRKRASLFPLRPWAGSWQNEGWRAHSLVLQLECLHSRLGCLESPHTPPPWAGGSVLVDETSGCKKVRSFPQRAL